MTRLKRIGAVLAMAFICMYANAQTVAAPQTDVMRSNGKIFVVMAVVLIIVVGLFAYLISIDKKLGRIEKGL